MLSFYDIDGFSDHPANQSSADRMLGLGIKAAICLLAYFLLKKIVFPLVKRFTEKTETTWDDHLFNSRVLNLAAYLLPALLAYMFVPMLFSDHPMTVTFIDKAFLLLIVAISTRLVCAFISSFQIISSESELLRKRPLTGIYHTFKILVVCVGIILAISILLNREPSTILAGLGASAAVLMLVFKDSIMGLVAGVLISGNMRMILKTVRKHDQAASYVRQGSMKVTRSNEDYLYSTVSKSAKPKNEDSGGGSSTHTSTSGDTFGGSSGKF